MEIALNLTFDDNATSEQIASDLQTAQAYATSRLRSLGRSLAVDEQIDLDLSYGVLQNATLNRFC